MIGLYCKKKHAATDKLCDDCEVLREYVFKRLDSCKFGNNKGTCGKCKVHCYKPEMRERIIKVMRYSGPRMLYTHPISAFRHLIAGLKKA
jgi:aerobic-type carbon monoxide dehydrogenase small subunit (CoxS/CutS family)